MSAPVYLSDDDRAIWQVDVEDCPDCQACDDERVCADHDLDDEDIALRYSGSGDEGANRWPS